jgi:hypothetical protein
MNGDLLGRVAPEGVQVFQFVIRRDANNPSQQASFLPFLGWFTKKKPIGYLRPANCQCKFILRADDSTFKAFYTAAGKPLPDKRYRYICPCYGDFLE